MSKSNFPVCAVCILFTNKNQRKFWTTRTSTVTVTTTSLMFLSPKTQKSRVRKGSKQKVLQSSCSKNTKQRYIIPEELNTSIGEFGSLIDSLLDFLKNFNQASKSLQIPISKLKTEIGLTKSKNNRSNTQYRLPFRFGRNEPCNFRTKRVKRHRNQSLLTKNVNLNNREIQQYYKKR